MRSLTKPRRHSNSKSETKSRQVKNKDDERNQPLIVFFFSVTGSRWTISFQTSSECGRR